MDKRYDLNILSPAQAELEEIARIHMALSGPQSARTITDKLFTAVEQLTPFPLSGPPVRDAQLSAGGYRYVLAGKYLIFYRLLGDTVFVYHIAHGATDYPKLFRHTNQGRKTKDGENK